MPKETIRDLVAEYLLERDLQPTTEAYYWTTIQVLTSWTRRPVLRSRFTPELVNRFLQAKQKQGLSSYYRKSLRNGLRALLTFDGRTGPIRRVRTHDLNHAVWTAAEVARIIRAVPAAIESKERRWFWVGIIQVAWYTGLERIDLVNRMTASQIAENGVVITVRHKTGRRVVARIPVKLAAELRKGDGQIWPFAASKELFRRQFKRIVTAAGLNGTFKKLRKSSGTASEALHPGCGHNHLANSRQIFERHYLSPQALPLLAFPPPTLPLFDPTK